jgi:hypothetical protein
MASIGDVEFARLSTSRGSCRDKFSLAMSKSKNARRLAPIWRAVIEVGFIIFLFYSNLLMGEFSRASGRGKTWVFAVEDVFTETNLLIAIASGLMGYVVVEYLRNKL